MTGRRMSLSLAGCLGLAILIAALGAPAVGQTPKRGGILNSMVIEDPPGFSIHEAATISTVWPMSPCYSNLVYFDPLKPQESADTVIPELAYPDIGAAIDWLTDAFGFSLRLRIADHRAQMNVGNGGAIVLITRPPGEMTGVVTHAVMVRVEDVDAHHERARSNGARVLRPPADYPYGERQYSVVDSGGHAWTFTQSIADVDPRDWGGSPGNL